MNNSDKRRYRAICESSKTGVWHLDSHGFTVYANPAMCRLLEVDSVAELSGIIYSEFFFDHYLESVTMWFTDRKATPEITLDSVIKGRKGGLKKVILAASPVPAGSEAETEVICTVVDISGVCHADNDLEVSRNTFDLFFGSSTIAMLLVSSEGRVRAVNSKFVELTGYAREDISDIENWFLKAYPDREYREYAEKEWAIALEHALKTNTEIRAREFDITLKDGSKRTFLINGVIRPGNLLISFVDITEIRRTESALAESEKKHRELLESLPQVIFEADHSGRLTYINRSGLMLYGYDYEDFLNGVNIVQTVDPADIERAKLNYAMALRGEMHQGNEYFARTKAGVRFAVLIYTSPIIENSMITGVRGVIIDITERKKAEEALKESERWFRELVELSPFSVVITSLEGRYLMVNQKFLETTEYTEEEILGKTMEEVGIIMEPDISQDIVREIMEKGYAENLDVKIFSKSGKEFDIYFSSKIIRMSNCPVIISVTVDITEKKKLEVELEKHRKDLEKLVGERTEALAAANEELTATNEELYNRHEELTNTLNALNNAQKQLIESEKMASLGVLAAGISHEINNPLNFIQGGIYGIEDYFYNHLRDHLVRVEPLIRGINEGVRRASDIVTSLNHFSRTSSSQDEKCDVHAIIENCLAMLKNQLKYKVEVEKDFTDSEYLIKGNEGKLHQAILNIIANASQSIREKGKITIRTKVFDNKMVISVSDTGCGISAENLPKIFDPFFTTKEPGEGTGLGLSITYKIIQEHRGEIFYTSQTGEGTTATIKLPLTKNDRNE